MNQHLNIERTKLLELINFNKTIAKARGAYLYSDTGDVYLDFTSQFGAVPFGHNPDFLWQTLIAQQAMEPGVMIQPFSTEGARKLSEMLVRFAPGDLEYVTFGCTGAEVVEIAIKMAKAKTRRNAVLSTENSFHGKTMAAVLATGNSYYSECFYPASEAFAHVPYSDVEALENALASKQYAAFIVEPIQGEGGMVVPQAGYLKVCEQLCRKYGTLLIVDEVQTGLGRTGKLFACDHENVEPDILLIAKALSGGLIPISACLANKRAWSKDFGQRHSATFANNHLAAMIGCKVMEKLTEEPDILDHVCQSGDYLHQQLTALISKFPAAFAAASGRGLMQGLVLKDWVDEESYLCPTISGQGFIVPLVSAYLLNRHHIFTMPTLNDNNVLRLQPNYLITHEEIDTLIHALDKVGTLITEGKFSELLRAAIGLKPQSPQITTRPYRNQTIVPAGEKLGTFCFFVHPVTEMHTIDCMPGGRDAYDAIETEKVLNWLDNAKSLYGDAAPAYYMPCIPSANGGYVDGWLISSLLTPKDMMRLPKDEKNRLMDSYIDIAQEKGANVIGLGAFTSVITRSGTTVADCGTPVTTGNAFTALTSTDSVRQICQARDIDTGYMTLGIVGVSGSVGRLCFLDIGAEFQKVCLIGNARNLNNVEKLEVVAGEFILKLFTSNISSQLKPMFQTLVEADINLNLINSFDIDQNNDYPGEKFRQIYLTVQQKFRDHHGDLKNFPLLLTNDIENTLPICDVVITATSNGEAFIQPELLAEGAIVCDVARPSDLQQEVRQKRADITAYDGGLVQLPAALRFGGPNIAELDLGVTLACLAETVILTMSQVKHSYSLGGVSSIEEARDVFQMALKHGFNTHLYEDDITGPVLSKEYA
ncbi:ornithine/acetylornithine aminotransferase [Gynuella sunshinyii YC6258]|uniref:Ornithine/acetylornithine aminotransferase n=1 Tax=Gynuella sunshinyii YC6258 TaxID=1445510 RepID=A0A0C5W3H3_9GAMM|nr:aminotransferase class III-fold pyridoxal phosphate-dependent enzyme [Gynuella sunshinyii]AJQ97179.1 ornithine/acetylornithine aminotransferase [Gynuella sunshinyii YC6258]